MSSKRTLVGSFEYGGIRATGTMTQNEHVIFAYEGKDQTKSWRIEEIQVWLNPMVESGGDGRALVNYCLSTDFLNPVDPSLTPAAFRAYADQFNAQDNRGIAWGTTDYHNRDATNNDFRIPAQGSVPFGMIANGRRAINYLILNVMCVSENALVATNNIINYRIVMTEIKIDPSESILHQVRGMAQDVDTNRPN